VTSVPTGPGGGPLPGHVAWVAGLAGGAVPGADREDRALLALVEAARGLGISRITVQEPSGGRALRAHAHELAARGVAVACMPPHADGTPRPRDLVEVVAPALSVLLADERSGRRDLVKAVRVLAARGLRPKDVDEAAISEALGVPDVDLLVLTGGDRRVPDLLVWQVKYSEIVVLEDHWPDLGAAQFHAAVAEYQRRDRRYGGLVASR